MPNSFQIKYDPSINQTQSFLLDESEINADMTDEDLTTMYTDEIDSHFSNNVWGDGLNLAEFLDWAHEMQAAQRERDHGHEAVNNLDHFDFGKV